ncbi:MAG TPA: anion permease, partial [Planctomycetaceae bacterium]
MTFDPSATRAGRLGQLAALAAFLVVLLSPVPSDLPGPARRVAAVAAAMGILWLTQAVPLGATSLIPLVAFPLLGVQGAKDVSKAYINESVFLYLGGFVVALGIERWGL